MDRHNNNRADNWTTSEAYNYCKTIIFLKSIELE